MEVCSIIEIFVKSGPLKEKENDQKPNHMLLWNWTRDDGDSSHCLHLKGCGPIGGGGLIIYG